MPQTMVVTMVVVAAFARPTHAEEPTPPPVAPVLATIERTACFGHCPEYTITVRTDGTVEWQGRANVAASGRRTVAMSKPKVRALIAAFTRARFFELDDRGRLPKRPVCHEVRGGLGWCDLGQFDVVNACSDLSHTILTVDLRGQHKRLDDDHCDTSPALLKLERQVHRLVGADALIGIPATPRR